MLRLSIISEPSIVLLQYGTLTLLICAGEKRFNEIKKTANSHLPHVAITGWPKSNAFREVAYDGQNI